MLLVIARKLMTSREILLWMTPSEAPKALQASECSELLDPTRASCWISAQHQPGKFRNVADAPCQPLLEMSLCETLYWFGRHIVRQLSPGQVSRQLAQEDYAIIVLGSIGIIRSNFARMYIKRCAYTLP